MDSQLGNLTSRRKFLSTCGAVGSVGLAGCTGGENPQPGQGSPEEVAERFLKSLNTGDRSELRKLTHSEQRDSISNETIAVFDAYEFEITQITTESQTSDKATVRVQLVFDLVTGPEVLENKLVLKKEQAKWRLYSVNSVSNEDGEETMSETSADKNNLSSPQGSDVTVSYTISVQNSTTNAYKLPEPPHKGWEWIVAEVVPTKGSLDTQEMWFRGFAETEERLYAVSHDSPELIKGIEARGRVEEGDTGIILHPYPRSPQSDVIGWNTSLMGQSVDGENIINDGPDGLYPPTSVEYSVTKSNNPSVLPSEYAERRFGDTWAVVDIKVTEGYLNMEDLWFRSRLTTGSYRHQISSYTQHATRGALSRGLIKPENRVQVLYLIEESESVEEWGYTEDSRQSVEIN